MDPLLRLLPALYTALVEPPLTYLQVPVPVFQFLNTPNRGYYVLLTQPTTTDLSIKPSCSQWSVTVLIDVVTQFEHGKISSIPAATLVDQITTRLRGKRLALPEGWDCSPGTLEAQNQVEEDGELIAVRRLLRFRWTISYNA